MKPIITLFSITLMFAMLFTISCSEREDIGAVYEERPPMPLTYDTDIKPIFDAGCLTCHSGGSPTKGYNLSTYAGVLGNGSDATPNAIPGDSANSLLITKFTSGNHSFVTLSASNQNMIIQWVVVDSLKEN